MSDATRNGADVLTILEPLVGVWIEQLDLADTPPGRITFEWALGGQVLIQRSEIGDPNVPDSLAIIAAAADGGGYHPAPLRLARCRPYLRDDLRRATLDAAAHRTRRHAADLRTAIHRHAQRRRQHRRCEVGNHRRQRDLA
jgi:hypothetical protein